jgi:hypothetical protein
VPPWVSGIERAAGSPDAARRRIVRALAVAAPLLVSALASAPALANNTVGTVLSAAAVGSPPASGGGGAVTPPPSPAGTTSPPDNAQPAPTAQQGNAATNTQTTTATGGGGGKATGGNAGSSHGASHGGIAYANGGNAESYSSLDNRQSNQTSGRHSSGPGYSGQVGQDVFVLKAAKRRGSGGAAAPRNHAKSPGAVALGAANRAARPEVNVPRDRDTAKASPSGGGLAGYGGELPGHNPFFNLLSGSGGAGAALILLLLAVLGASIALPNYRFKAFRTPTVTWRPLAYVPPIELPG